MSDWKALALATMVGSMPHQDRKRVIDLILQEFPSLPVWPQLSAYPSEQMMVQYLEGLPGLGTEQGRLVVRTDEEAFEPALLAFYEEYLEVDSGQRSIESSRFAFGPDAGRTFREFLEALGANPAHRRAVKGQVVGPFTLLAGLKDQQDRALLYDERLQDVVIKLLAMKARWQIEQLKPFGERVIIFLDEPALAGFGSSAFISVSRELVHQLLQEIVDVIHQSDALAGVHVCANTDWNLAFDADIDIINLDAYSFLDRFVLYREPFDRFLAAGGTVAWGMVPTSDAALIARESAPRLAARWLDGVKELVSSQSPLSVILSQSLFTPSCGCGSLSESNAERVAQLTRELGEILQAKL